MSLSEMLLNDTFWIYTKNSEIVIEGIFVKCVKKERILRFQQHQFRMLHEMFSIKVRKKLIFKIFKGLTLD